MSKAKENTPFFSIVIPTFNRANFLVKTINSILDQIFVDFEVIVVDDGSTDDTKNVVTHELIDARIRYFYKKNEERSIARNYGIKEALGKYVTFLDSDDIVYNNHLAKAFELIEKNDFPEVGHLGYELKDENWKTLLIRNSFNKSSRKELIDENIFHGNAIFIRKDIIDQTNFIPNPNAILSEDWYLWLRLAARYEFHFDNTITSAVIHHNNRSLKNIDPDKLIANTNTIVDYLQRDQPFLTYYKNKVSYHFANHYTFLTLILALSKTRRWDTIKYLIIAFYIDPSVAARKRFWATIKHWF